MKITHYKGFKIETYPKQNLEAEMQTSIIFDTKGNPIGGSCGTKYSKVTSEEKAKLKIDSYKAN